MKNTKPALRILTCTIVLSMLSGCFLYLPHHKMKIVDKAEDVAFTAFGGAGSVALFCTRADLRGSTTGGWTQFAVINFNGGLADKKKTIVNTGYTLETVPDICWSPLTNTNSTKNFSTLIRIGDDASWGTVSKTGLRCLGDLFAIGKLAGYESCGRFDAANQPKNFIEIFAKR